MLHFTDGTVITVPAWTHHRQELYESRTIISGSVYGGLTDDPYLQDYPNVLGLLQDLLSRLALTEDDLEQKLPARRSSKAIHLEAELNEEVATASDREEDYFVSEAAASLTYGSINGRDVLGSLIQQLLRPFREMAESAGEKQSEDPLSILHSPHMWSASCHS
ncbi:hypothetical protein [Paenibacillus sp. HJGM_3]|uniref:hypothetical protein n=1 Tax=Paenibacillus sp. HJGM_3 TaxID=3379816 RepID=UPI00385BF2B3